MKLSVIMPIYNGQEYLEEAINSVLSLNILDMELLLINDGSKDKSELICRSFEQKDTRVKYTYKNNGGIVSSRNMGLEMAQGDYVSFVDQDDLIVKEGYKKALQRLDATKAEIGFFSTQKFSQNVSVTELGKVKYECEIDKSDVSVKLLIPLLTHDFKNEAVLTFIGHVWGAIYRREFLAKNNIFFKRFVSIEDDYLFLLDGLTKANKVSCVQEVGYRWRTNLQSTTYTRKYYEGIWPNYIKLYNYITYTAKDIVDAKEINKMRVGWYQSALKIVAMQLVNSDMSYTNQIEAYRIITSSAEAQKALQDGNFSKYNTAEKVLFTCTKVKMSSIGYRLYYYIAKKKSRLVEYGMQPVHVNKIFKKIFLHFKGKQKLNWLSDETYLKILFAIRNKYKLNLDDPKTYNAKLQWLKLYYHRAILTELVDKYTVRKYIAEKIGEDYLVPLLGVWEHFDEIDFSTLPQKFVLKTTHDSGGVVICKDINSFDKKKAKTKLESSLKNNFYYVGREWPYKNVKPRIIAEQYLSEFGEDSLKDYKIMCFNGKAKCSFVCTERRSKTGLKVTFFDRAWNVMPFCRHYPKSNNVIDPPQNIDLMYRLAEKLSKDFPFVRVDFYEVDGKCYFGELTFFPGSGMEEFDPPIYDYKLGEWLHLPKEKII